jgi:glycerol-3-phosphate dehydrogenase
MKRDPEALSRKHFDLAVIGGGIHGAATAREAALRGLKVALVEGGDFASGTSSRSSKLIHGGLRYLEQYDFRLVREARRERRLLQTLAPHLARPVPFLLPVFRGDPYSPLKIRVGLTIYDLLGNLGPADRHRMLTAQGALAAMPALKADGLRGGAVYHDSQTDDARLTIENVIDAADHGAVAVNYAEVRAFNLRSDRVLTAEVEDRRSGNRYELASRYWVNAAGPWVDRVRSLLPGYDGSRTVRLTKGTHLLIPPVTGAYALLAAVAFSDRIFLVVPWHDSALLGTTDTDYAGDPAAVAPSQQDTEYLLAAANGVLSPPLRLEDVRGAWAGVRALALPPAGSKGGSPSAATREYRFHSDPWALNLISVCGGKLTTARALAEKLATLVISRLGTPASDLRSLSSRTRALPGGGTGPFDLYLQAAAADARREFGMAPFAATRVVRTYGSRWREVLGPARDDTGLAQPVPGRPQLLIAEVLFSVREEMALTAEDFLMRRSGLNWTALTVPEARAAIEPFFPAPGPQAISASCEPQT